MQKRALCNLKMNFLLMAHTMSVLANVLVAMYVRVYAFVSVCVWRLRRRWGAPTPEWKITKVLLIREEAPGRAMTTGEDDFFDISAWFPYEPDTWKHEIERLFPLWTHWKMEVRYEHRGAKYRAVMRQDEDMQWPPPVCPPSPQTRTLAAPEGIVLAHLMSPVDGVAPLDVTQRVRKYFGVTRDFGSRKLFAQDIFPMDDNEDTASRFSTLRIVQMTPAVKFSNYDFKNNERIN